MSDNHLIHRPAQLTRCAACSSLVLVAITYGGTVHADPQSLSIPGEITARMTGKTVYDILTGQQRIWLEPRSYTRVRSGRKFPVVADHHCRNPSSRAAARMELVMPRGKQPERKITRKRVAVSEEVPF